MSDRDILPTLNDGPMKKPTMTRADILDAAKQIVTQGRELQYGKPDSNSPIYSSSVFSKSLKNSAGIDNHLVETDDPDAFDVTHIRVVMASSALGNVYKGSVGALLYCDEMRLIYE